MSQRSMVALIFVLFCSGPCFALETFEFGFAKRDITPERPLRLSGYGTRSEVFESIDEKLYARVMALRSSQSPLSIMVSVDTIGFPETLTKAIAERVEKDHSVTRDRFLICCTHSHTSPQIAGGLTNILAVPLTADQAAATKQYTDRIADEIVLGVKAAVADLKAGVLTVGESTASFARNRRVLTDGIWTGFGVNPKGPSDHALPVLKITDPAGKMRGVVFNYACHCTTFGGRYNRVNGDWAGYAAANLEAEHPGIVALCTIGCGADQNPVNDSDSDRALDLSRQHGKEIATQADMVLRGEMQPVTAPLVTSFGYAGLPIDRPSTAELQQALQHPKIQTRRHAEHMLDLERRMGRLPETYPAPVQVWRFGQELCMVFLGGEVVVDYALRLKKEIATDQVWISAYCNDVFGYVCSEKMRAEGGYEVEGSMIYYDQPGPWSTGTEEVLVRRVHELVEEGSFAGPFSPADAKKTFHLSPGFDIELVASEPMLRDPVNFDVGADGKLWVVEMGDYPRGENGQGSPGGRIRFLEDTNGDGRYDTSTLFLDGLEYPNGVTEWGNGVLISGAPSILYAEDTDGDGRADLVEPLYTGFEEENPQHRISGFAYGLDHWLYLASGTNNQEIESLKSGERVNMSGRDLRIAPQSGGLATVTGRTQFGRNRDDWGNWFGGDNSKPVWHFMIADHYLARNPYFPTPSPIVHLMSPPLAPEVFPTSRTLDRFNDLFALNRFTSACSPMVYRGSYLGADIEGSIFVAEPVHNLVHRSLLVPDGFTFEAVRAPAERNSEFLSSTDHWFRPTTIKTGPDGALWVADMYRSVIEHPQWIPEAWQAKLNLRAGEELGRIWRIVRTDSSPPPVPNLANMDSNELIAELASDNGWRRDTAQRLLIEGGDTSIRASLRKIIEESDRPKEVVHALGVMQGLGLLDEEVLLNALHHDAPQVIRRGILLSEPFLDASPELGQTLCELTDHPDAALRLQLAMSLGEWNDTRAAVALGELASRDIDDIWMRTAVLTAAAQHANTILTQVLSDTPASRDRSEMVQHLIATSLGSDVRRNVGRVLGSITEFDAQPETWQIEALASLDRAIRRKKLSLASLAGQDDAGLQETLHKADVMVDVARAIAGDSRADLEKRLTAVGLLGRGFKEQELDLDRLTSMLVPQSPVELQIATVQALGEFDFDSIPKRLYTNWKQLSPTVQSEILATLLSKKDWHVDLLNALEEGTIAVSDLDATTRMRLASASNRALRDRARSLLGSSGNSDRQSVLEAFQAVTEIEGDPVRGAKYFETACAACHRHNGIGNEIGPSFANLQDKSNSSMLTSMLDPNRAVEGKYKSYLVATVDGVVINGLLVNETTSGITIAQPNGTQRTLLRVDIDQMAASGVSFMPEGLEKDLSPQAIADIFEFIRAAPAENRTSR